MKNKTLWANIICDEHMRPNLLIVTDGEWDTRVPVSNSKLSIVKRAATDFYGVKPRNIIVTKILGDTDEHPEG